MKTFKKNLAIFLSFALTVLSAGPGALSAFAGVARVSLEDAVPISPISISLAPAALNDDAATLPGGAGFIPEKEGALSNLELVPLSPISPKPAPRRETRKKIGIDPADKRELSAAPKSTNAFDFSPRKTISPSHGGAPLIAREKDGFGAAQALLNHPIDFDGDANRRPSVEVQSDLGTSKLSEIKQVLADGVVISGQLIRPFSFHLPDGNWTSARDEGLEGFLYSKRELERSGQGNLSQLDDYFHYLETLLSPFSWTIPANRTLEAIRSSGETPEAKNAELNAYLVRLVADYQGLIQRADPSLWTRKSSTYLIFSRAYNQIHPGKNFLDSLDEAELARIRDEIKADSLWLMDIFEIGDVHRWGTSGGSAYSIKGYRVKPELGGDEGLKNLVLRAKAMGLKVGVDFIPNHVSLDSDFIKEFPEGVMHIVPPQDLSDDQIMAQVPLHNGKPAFYLLHSDHYPENGGFVQKKILVQYPITDYGGDMWTDLAQMDYSRPETRQWELDQTAKLFGPWKLDFVRRDMAYEILNSRYFPRWIFILEMERDASRAWMREALSQFITDFKARQAILKNAEFMAQMAQKARTENPAAGLYDEAYTNFSDLSRAGSSAVYNKNDHDGNLGQRGLYDAIVSASSGGNVAGLVEALKNIAFRMWQQGGAAELNFVGTHDGGEGNPVDKFGRYFKAAALTALLFRPTLIYNGLEQGVGQALNLIGDLSKSNDTQKAIPFDIPVLINWKNADLKNQEYLKTLWDEGEKHKEFIGKALEILTPKTSSSIVAWSAGHVENGVQKALIGVANFGGKTGAFFNMDSPVLKDFGAFSPRADRDYILRDVINTQKDGSPTVYRRSGAELLKDGLYVGLDEGQTQLFEVEEVLPQPQLGIDFSGGRFSALLQGVPPDPTTSRWDALTQRFVKISWGIFGLLQLPQIWANTVNLAAVHPLLKNFLGVFGVLPGHLAAISGIPFIGVLSGILADSILMSYFIGSKEYTPAVVQTIGVVMASLMLAQVALAGFVPLAVYFTALPLILAHLALNFLKWKNRLPEKIAGISPWDGWQKGLSLLGLFFLPAGISSMLTSASANGVSLLLGGVAALTGLGFMIAESRGKLPSKWKGHWASFGAWLATLLFMFMPIAQIHSVFNNSVGIHGLALPSFLMGAMGNLLMLPRAILTQNRIWFVGSAWAVLVGGLGVFFSLLANGFMSAGTYFGVLSVATLAFFYYALKRNQKYFKESSLWHSLRFLISKK